MKSNSFTKPMVALAALAVIGAGASAGALASAQTATTTVAPVGQVHPAFPGVHGKITAISGNTITIVNERDNTTYTVNASGATVMKGSEGSAPAVSSVSALIVGDEITAVGTVSGTSVTATKITSGLMGMGHGFGPGRGHGVMGTVTAVNGNTITVSNPNGTSYTIDASSATVSKVVDVTVGDIKVGDRVGAQGTLTGTNVVATHIMTGLPEKPANTSVQQ